MSDKSYVTMEAKVCMICGLEYSTNAILMDQRLRPRFDRTTVTGWGMCDEHRAAINKDYVGLIEVDEAKSKEQPNGQIMLHDAYRTGRVVLVKREALQRALVGMTLGDDTKFMFIGIDAFNKMLPPDVLETVPESPERSTQGDVAPGSNSIN